MTESEWLASTDPERMLWHMTSLDADSTLGGLCAVATDRKLRLFAVACCRQVWDKLTDERSRQAVEVAEKYADGEVANCDLAAAREAAWNAAQDAARDAARAAAQAAAWTVARPVARAAARAAAREAAQDAARAAAQDAAWNIEAALLRCAFGNPWRPVFWWQEPHEPSVQTGPFCGQIPSGLHKRILRWRDGTVPKIAANIYNNRRFDEMPILADALEEAGCKGEDMLMHCRGRERCPCALVPDARYQTIGVGCMFRCNGTGWLPLGCSHVRGCWVLDLLLGKGMV